MKTGWKIAKGVMATFIMSAFALAAYIEYEKYDIQVRMDNSEFVQSLIKMEGQGKHADINSILVNEIRLISEEDSELILEWLKYWVGRFF